ncbi:MAG: hypothetical protein ACYTJ0_10110 [Planctomycetota bacterium]|jgi:hypothetical protein
MTTPAITFAGPPRAAATGPARGLSRQSMAAGRVGPRPAVGSATVAAVPRADRLGGRPDVVDGFRPAAPPRDDRLGSRPGLDAAIRSAGPASPRLGSRHALAAAAPEPFAATLRRATAEAAAAAPDELRDAASQLVASAFVLPVLQSVREGPFNDGPLAPGAAERRFAPLLDQHLADRVTRGASFRLVDVIVQRLSGAAIPRRGGAS